MPSPSDSSSVASMSGSRALSGSRRGMSGRTSARLLLYLGLCHLALGAMVLAFSFTSLAFTSSPRVRQSCPFWAGFFVSFFEYINNGMTCQQCPIYLSKKKICRFFKIMDIGQKMSLDLQYNFFVSVEQVVASGVVGVISWRRPFTLVVCTVSSQHDLLSVSICLLVFSFCSDVIFVSFRCRCSCCCLQCV